MFNKKNLLIAVLSPHTIELYSAGTATPQVIPLPNSVIDYQELVSEEALNSLVAEWTHARPYVATEIIWLLSTELCYEQVLSNSDRTELASLTTQFIDSIPFEEVLSRAYPVASGVRIFATNKVLVDSLIQAFGMHGYATKAVVPISLYKVNGNTIFNYQNQYLKDSLIAINAPQEKPSLAPENKPNEKKNGSTLPILIPVFIALLLILAFVIWRSR